MNKKKYRKEKLNILDLKIINGGMFCCCKDDPEEKLNKEILEDWRRLYDEWAMDKGGDEWVITRKKKNKGRQRTAVYLPVSYVYE